MNMIDPGYNYVMQIICKNIHKNNLSLHEIYKIYKILISEKKFELISTSKFKTFLENDCIEKNGIYKFKNNKIYLKFLNSIDRRTERNTEYFMQSVFMKKFGDVYDTSKNDIFGSLIPDGYYLTKNTFYIIENKRSENFYEEGFSQLKKYMERAHAIFGKYINIIGILGIGTTKEMFKYYSFDLNMNKIKNSF